MEPYDGGHRNAALQALIQYSKVREYVAQNKTAPAQHKVVFAAKPDFQYLRRGLQVYGWLELFLLTFVKSISSSHIKNTSTRVIDQNKLIGDGPRPLQCVLDGFTLLEMFNIC